MEQVSVGLGDRAYEILIGDGILSQLGQQLERINFPRRIAILTNEQVAPLYLDSVQQELQNAGYDCSAIIVADGEEHKNLTTLNLIFDRLIEQQLDRGSGLIALGGGVIGDMAGFAAASYLRGIPFVQVPTTILSQVDSSVGGKTGVNHRYGKNLIGAFYQPQLVLIDIATLRTLEPRERRAGLAEVIKYGVIHDADFFTWLENHSADLLNLEPQTLTHAVKRSCQIKADIVEVDEREGSVRALLNYGHTFGHAIENLSGYGEWRHGEAIACGMLVAARISHHLQFSPVDTGLRIENLLTALGLPREYPHFSLDRYVDAMLRDKKVRQGHLKLVLNRQIGQAFLHAVDDVSSLFGAVLPELEG